MFHTGCGTLDSPLAKTLDLSLRGSTPGPKPWVHLDPNRVSTPDPQPRPSPGPTLWCERRPHHRHETHVTSDVKLALHKTLKFPCVVVGFRWMKVQLKIPAGEGSDKNVPSRTHVTHALQPEVNFVSTDIYTSTGLQWAAT